jgi:DNA polymerase-3 subunit gamma/tau
MVGNFKGFEALVKKENRPHAYLFNGPSGCGKSTASRILATMFGAKGQDIREYNTGNTRGIDTIREIIANLRTSPLSGDSVVYIIDECHQLTVDAMNALLKPLEDTPSHVYFILCTSEPSKVIVAIKTRCFDVNFGPIPDDDLFSLVKDISQKEGYKIPGADANLIVDASAGSARKALVILESVLAHPNKNAKEVISAMGSGDDPAEVMELCRAIYSTGGKKTVKTILSKLKSQGVPAENIRRALLGYGGAILLSGQQKEKPVIDIMENFMGHTYDTGFPGIVLMCSKAMLTEETF